MPHFGAQGGKPIHERSGRELIWMFVVLPWILGIVILVMIFVSLHKFQDVSTWKDWLGVVWGTLLSLALMIGLPAAAWQEWQRRKQFRANSEGARSPNPGDSP